MTRIALSPARRAITATSAVALLGLTLAGCSASPAEAPESTTASETAPTASPTVTAAEDPATASAATAHEILAQADLDGSDARDVIDTLDALPLDDRPGEFMASIRPDELVITSADGTEGVLPMPEDEFYVSLAPYVNTTHDCYYHSLTTCTGELGNSTIDVLVTDVDTGDVLIEESTTVNPNGFVGLWLPRDAEVEVTFDVNGQTATEQLSTSESDDATCVTTMQLA